MCALSFFALGSASADDEAHEKLQPLQFLIGQWTGEYELPAAIPEVGAEKGAKVDQHFTIDWILDGAAIEMRNQITIDGKPQPSSKAIIAWDPEKKEISHFMVSGSGFLGGGSWQHEDGDWLLKWKSATAYGGYTGTSIHRQKSDDSFEWQMINVSQAGKKLPDWPLVQLNRVTPLQEAWVDYMEGSWEFEFEDGRVGDVTWVRAGDTPALTFTAETKSFSIAGVIGWHQDQGAFLETDFSTDGYLQRKFGEITRDSLSGMQTWQDTTFGVGRQKLEYRRISEDEMTLTGSASDLGGMDWVVRFKRKN
jgi:hypothetical protein